MPVLYPTYTPPVWLPNAHAETIFPALFRSVSLPPPERHRLELTDGDFIDYDWYPVAHQPSAPICVVSHGLEGDSKRSYVTGFTRIAQAQGYAVVAWNYRGCSGEPNRLLRFYHSGESDDLRQLLDRVVLPKQVTVYLIGISVGGNITLKYLGEEGAAVSHLIKAAATLSVPCDLSAGAHHLARSSNRLYMWRFLRSLEKKIQAKALRYPSLDTTTVKQLKTFLEFDTHYTAPIHGFPSAEVYWTKSSSKPLLHFIQVPTLILSALNDPFLPPACFPVNEATSSDVIHLHLPSKGGHVGFYQSHPKGYYWSEEHLIEFIRQYD
ncbi:MAG: alpha/beta fold hydrolase [Cytophagaceae bacterium]|nr:alpha/beta fold hydrolase [Cytophagaceae bacterium]